MDGRRTTRGSCPIPKSVGAAEYDPLSVTTVAGSVILATFLAVLLNVGVRGTSIYRVLLFLPVVTMPAASAMVWKWLYNGEFGLLNAALQTIGIDGPSWLTDKGTALWAVAAVVIWNEIGISMIILLAGLQGISRTLTKAAGTRRRRPVLDVLRHHAAASDADALLRHRHVDHQRVPDVRRHLPDDRTGRLCTR